MYKKLALACALSIGAHTIVLCEEETQKNAETIFAVVENTTPNTENSVTLFFKSDFFKRFSLYSIVYGAARFGTAYVFGDDQTASHHACSIVGGLGVGFGLDKILLNDTDIIQRAAPIVLAIGGTEIAIACDVPERIKSWKTKQEYTPYAHRHQNKLITELIDKNYTMETKTRDGYMHFTKKSCATRKLPVLSADPHASGAGALTYLSIAGGTFALGQQAISFAQQSMNASSQWSALQAQKKEKHFTEQELQAVIEKKHEEWQVNANNDINNRIIPTAIQPYQDYIQTLEEEKKEQAILRMQKDKEWEEKLAEMKARLEKASKPNIDVD